MELEFGIMLESPDEECLLYCKDCSVYLSSGRSAFKGLCFACVSILSKLKHLHCTFRGLIAAEPKAELK